MTAISIPVSNEDRLQRGQGERSVFYCDITRWNMPPSASQPLYWLNGVMDTCAHIGTDPITNSSATSSVSQVKHSAIAEQLVANPPELIFFRARRKAGPNP